MKELRFLVYSATGGVAPIRQRFLHKDWGKAADDEPVWPPERPLPAARTILCKLMGVVDTAVFVDPRTIPKEDLPNILDDLDFDYAVESDEGAKSVENRAKLEETLRKFSKTAFTFINPPRPGSALLVLDLDHTLLDFSDPSLPAAQLSRPLLIEFMTGCYAAGYDIGIW
jgi:hypothetical protein